MARSKPKPVREWATPPEIAAEIGCSPEAIVGFIRSQELRGVDFARPGSSRPRYRVSRRDLEQFLDRRAVSKPPAPPRRTRNTPDVTEYV